MKIKSYSPKAVTAAILGILKRETSFDPAYNICIAEGCTEVFQDNMQTGDADIILKEITFVLSQWMAADAAIRISKKIYSTVTC